MKLLVDIGNSTIKYAFFEKGEMISVDRINHADYKTLIDASVKNNCTRAMICASGKVENDLLESLRKVTDVMIFDDQTKLPISLDYETPSTLGKDRIAGVCGAWKHFPGETSLVIDMGTCITTNIINQDGIFLGGTISPGVKMRAKAMHSFTEKLPVVELQFPTGFIGKNTIESLQNGVMRGTYYEIQAFLDHICPVYGINNVILTGGDAKLFVNLLNFEIFALPNLVLTGLHEILQYNA